MSQAVLQCYNIRNIVTRSERSTAAAGPGLDP
jgi:hypothetical protein